MGNRTLAIQLTSRRAPFPYEVEYLWNWFNELTWGLKADGMGPVMASWGDVLNWCAAVDVDADPWERKALVRLSHARAMVSSEKQDKTNGNPGSS